jgi:phosphoribosylformylglycinamidine (FGAM) synthase-like amidotransferase family enzyme
LRVEVYAPGVPPSGDVLVIPPGLPRGVGAGVGEALRAWVRRGAHVIGLADGAAWLCEAGLLPGVVTDVGPQPAATHVRVEGRATAFTWAIPAGRILGLGAPVTGVRYAAPEPEVARLGSRGQIVLRFCDAAGGVDRRLPGAATVAGLADDSGRVVGLFAPATPDLADELGRQILACLRERPAKGSPSLELAAPLASSEGEGASEAASGSG